MPSVRLLIAKTARDSQNKQNVNTMKKRNFDRMHLVDLPADICPGGVELRPLDATSSRLFSDQKWRVKTKHGVSCNDAKRWISTN
ncbi:uncharacterized protein LOC111263520 isoform X2 [Varroa jacobsoni]|uniref:uncharacterized protein LOC111263520 isoform X2 n=1 Tax=Varroa jacobsoni TaxID=62625 RepID=UPI000BF2FF51|nr:uncharacterized protein LOC111263520 isoform X2 [Varroa jacobsoni]